MDKTNSLVLANDPGEIAVLLKFAKLCSMITFGGDELAKEHNSRKRGSERHNEDDAMIEDLIAVLEAARDMVDRDASHANQHLSVELARALDALRCPRT